MFSATISLSIMLAIASGNLVACQNAALQQATIAPLAADAFMPSGQTQSHETPGPGLDAAQRPAQQTIPPRLFPEWHPRYRPSWERLQPEVDGRRLIA